MKENPKPDAPLIGACNHILNLTSIAYRTLVTSGLKNQADEMYTRVKKADSQQNAVGIIGEYVNFVEAEPDITVDEDEAFHMDMKL